MYRNLTSCGEPSLENLPNRVFKDHWMSRTLLSPRTGWPGNYNCLVLSTIWNIVPYVTAPPRQPLFYVRLWKLINLQLHISRYYSPPHIIIIYPGARTLFAHKIFIYGSILLQNCTAHNTAHNICIWNITKLTWLINIFINNSRSWTIHNYHVSLHRPWVQFESNKNSKQC